MEFFFIVGYFKVVADSIELWERKTKISWNQTSRTEGSASKQTTYWPNLAVQTKARDEPQLGSLLVIDLSVSEMDQLNLAKLYWFLTKILASCKTI